jgi:hypothetical protein
MISVLRHNDPRYSFNLMPQLVGVNIALKLDWDHDPISHVCSSDRSQSAFAVFYKRQSFRTPDGMCSYRSHKGKHQCSGVWEDAEPTRWSKVRYPDGTEEDLWRPGTPAIPITRAGTARTIWFTNSG